MALRLDAAGVDWLLAGGAARLLRDGSARPRDVDIEVREEDAARAAEALGLPAPAIAEGGGWRSLRAEGALAGVPVDLSGGLAVTGPGGTLRGPDPAAPTSRERSRRRGHPGEATVHLLPDGEALARAVVCGDASRERAARAALPVDPVARAEALAYAESRIAEAASAAR